MEILAIAKCFIVDVITDGINIISKINSWFDNLGSNQKFIMFIVIFVIPFYLSLLTHNEFIGTWVSLVILIRVIGVAKGLFFDQTEKQEEDGFTFIGLLLIISVIGILAAMVISYLQSANYIN